MKHTTSKRALMTRSFALGLSALALFLVPANAETPAAAPQKIPTIEADDVDSSGIVELPDAEMIVTAPEPEPEPEPAIEVSAPEPEAKDKAEDKAKDEDKAESESEDESKAEPVEEKKEATKQESGKTPFTEGDMTKAEEKDAPVAKSASAPAPTQEATRSSSTPRTSPGSNQDKARVQAEARGWGSDQFTCLSKLWMKESSWNHLAENSSSGAYGIPQALPASKMASHGSDYRTNPDTQIAWGLDYISDRYGTPCSAWAHSQQKNWY